MGSGIIEFRAVPIRRGGLHGRKRAAAANSQVLALYLELPSAPSLGVPTAPFSISSIMVFDGDILVRRRIYSVMNMWLYGATKTLYPTASGSLATAALSLAASDHAVREALSLVGSGEPTWPRIYDIIEFLGGPRLIEESGLASKKKLPA